MKKLLTMAAVAVTAVCLLALSACGGATSTLSSFVSAVKEADLEAAAEYVVDGSIPSSCSSLVAFDDEIDEYMYSKTAGSFKYSVVSSSLNEEGTVTTVEISYSKYSYNALKSEYETIQAD